MPLGMEVGLSLGDFVLDGNQHLPQKGRSPTQFSAHVYCGQTAAWMKNATWYGGRPRPTRHCVRCGPRLPSYHQKKAHPPHPIFGLSILWPNGWMDEDAAWYGSRPRPRPHIVLDRVPAPAKGPQQPPPSFRPRCRLWPRSPISATAELLLIVLTDFDVDFDYSKSTQCLVMAALWNKASHYIFIHPVVSFFYLSFYIFSSPNLSGRRLDVYHTSTHGVALLRI